MITDSDPYLRPFERIIRSRQAYAARLKGLLLEEYGAKSLADFADAHLYYGLHFSPDGSCLLRDYAPGATAIFLVCDGNGWQRDKAFAFTRVNRRGDWSLALPPGALRCGDHYKLAVEWDGGCGERIPTFADYVVQDADTHIFSACVPEAPSQLRYARPGSLKAGEPLLIYEAHVGMSSETEGVATYASFCSDVLPRIAALGYNAVQLMAIQEHPYYASFGYHVSNFFAPSSRFGTPNDLRALIDEAHRLGLRVIMDLVHSHAVRNTDEGPGSFDGNRSRYFHTGDRGEHPAWDSLCFDYAKPATLHFLLSNCRYWTENFGFDGFRFDGVSSMLYLDHGLGKTFTSYNDYFDGNQDGDAIAYLMLAQELIHELVPSAITIAEEVSGFPGLGAPIADGGLGFDYRLAMNIPDYWIKLIAELPDERWSPGEIFHELTNRRSDESTISYAESHDQALVGDKTLIFRLADKEMYFHMSRSERNYHIDRALSLVKLIRLATVGTMGGGYLNFMGNEFGHPEWVDFPRKGNDWSYRHARRQWSLAKREDLRYGDLSAFEHDLLSLIGGVTGFGLLPVDLVSLHESDQILAFMRGELLFVFNFSAVNSYADYRLPVPPGCYCTVLDTDATRYSGFGFCDDAVSHFSLQEKDPADPSSDRHFVYFYLPARTAFVFIRT